MDMFGEYASASQNALANASCLADFVYLDRLDRVTADDAGFVQAELL